MVTDGHRVVANQVHAAKVGLGVLQIGFRHAGIDIASRQQQHAAALGCHLFTNAVHQRFLRRQTIFAIFTAPEMTMMIVGMQNGDFIGFIFFIRLRGQAYQTPCGDERQRDAPLH